MEKNQMAHSEHLLELIERYIEEAIAFKQLNREKMHLYYHLEAALDIKHFLETEKCPFGNTCLDGHITASAWILNESNDSVILTHHKKLNRWLQLGGHTEIGESIEASALREAQEESGLQHLVFVTPGIFDVDVHEIPARGDVPSHLHYDVRFLLRVLGNQDLSVSDESHDVKWVKLNEVTHYSDEPSIVRMTLKTTLHVD